MAQSELDKFKTEEELAKEKEEMTWYDQLVREVKVQFDNAYKYVSSFFIENSSTVKTALDEANIFKQAEEAVIDRNNAAEARAKSLQEKTGLKGEAKDMDDIINNKELHYEVKDFHEIQEELKK